MLVEMSVKQEVEITHVRLQLPVRYGEDDIPSDFPFRYGDMWDVTVEMDTGRIVDWPDGVEHDLYMKVTDCGNYTLFQTCENGSLREVASIVEDYVPHGLVPGEYGDYVSLHIRGDGIINNWPEVDDIDLSEFPGFQKC